MAVLCRVYFLVGLVSKVRVQYMSMPLFLIDYNTGMKGACRNIIPCAFSNLVCGYKKKIVVHYVFEYTVFFCFLSYFVNNSHRMY
jgi:hypothetical protein